MSQPTRNDSAPDTNSRWGVARIVLLVLYWALALFGVFWLFVLTAIFWCGFGSYCAETDWLPYVGLTIVNAFLLASPAGLTYLMTRKKVWLTATVVLLVLGLAVGFLWGWAV